MSRNPVALSFGSRREAEATLSTVTRAAICLGRGPMNALQEAEEHFPDDRNLRDVIQRGAVVPTSTSGVTAFNQTAVRDVAALVPMSAYGIVTPRAGIAVTLDTPASVQTTPGVTASSANFGFTAEGAPFRQAQLSFSSVSLTAHKAATGTVLTNELIRSPNAEPAVKQVLAENISLGIDKLFLDDVDTDGVRPAGLRYGVAAATSGGATKMVDDIADITATVALKAGSLNDVVLICDSATAIKIALYLPNLKIPVIATAGLAADTMIALATNCLAVAASPSIEIKVSEEAVVHLEDTSPAAFSTVGTPNVVAAPQRSMFQTDCTSIRLIFSVDWKLRTTGAIAWMTGYAW